MSVRRTGVVTAAVVVLVALGQAPAAGAASLNVLGDGGFESPVVSGQVAESGPIGSCTTVAPFGDEGCWAVSPFGVVALVHNDFQDTGVAWAPKSGKQLAELSGPSGPFTGGGVVAEIAPVAGATRYTLKLAYAVQPNVPAASGDQEVEVQVALCSVAGGCRNVRDVFGVANATGDPGAPGWQILRVHFTTKAKDAAADIRIGVGPFASFSPNLSMIVDAASLTPG